jgi:GNAT superfamily N-acetyltransferase
MTHDDVADVVAACEWLFEPPGSTPSLWDPSAAAERLTQVCGSRSGSCIVGVDDRSLVAFCTVYLDLVSIRFGQRAWLNELAVHPLHRSAGVGKRLLDAAKQWARDRGATHLMVDSGVLRSEAHRFYLREGPDMQANCFGWLL